jgi:hypothetical protein
MKNAWNVKSFKTKPKTKLYSTAFG